MDQDVDDEVVRPDVGARAARPQLPFQLAVLKPSPFLTKFTSPSCFDLQDQLGNRGFVGLGAVPRLAQSAWPAFAPFPRATYPASVSALASFPPNVPDPGTLPPIPAAPSLITLPTEILSRVVLHLRPDLSTTSFALTHRTLTPIAHRHIWRTLDFLLPRRYGEMGLTYSLPRGGPGLSRQHYTSEIGYYGSVYSARQKAILFRLLGLLSQMDRQPGLELLIDNIIVEMGGIAAAEYAQLLRLVSPTLKRLSLLPWYRGDQGVVSEADRSNLNAGQTITTLSTDEFCAQLFIGHLSFRSLTTLVLTFGGPSHGNHLARVLACCPALEIFSYRGGGRGNSVQAPLMAIPTLPKLRSMMYDNTDCEPMGLCKALVSATPNLVELTMADSRVPCTGLHRVGDNPERETAVAGMLDHLDKLKVVKWRYGGTSFFDLIEHGAPESIEILAVRSSLFSHVMELPDFVHIPPMPNLRVMYAYHSTRYREHRERGQRSLPIFKGHGLVIPLFEQNIYRSILAAPNLEAVYFSTPFTGVDSDIGFGLPIVPYGEWELGKTRGMLVRSYHAEGFQPFVHLRVRTRSKEVFKRDAEALPKKRKKKTTMTPSKKPTETPLAETERLTMPNQAADHRQKAESIPMGTSTAPSPATESSSSGSSSSDAAAARTAATIPLPPSPPTEAKAEGARSPCNDSMSDISIALAPSIRALASSESIPELSLDPAAQQSAPTDSDARAQAVPLPDSPMIAPSEENFDSLDDTFFQDAMTKDPPPVDPSARLLNVAASVPLPPSPALSPTIVPASPSHAANNTTPVTSATVLPTTLGITNSSAGAAAPPPVPVIGTVAVPAAPGPAPVPAPGAAPAAGTGPAHNHQHIPNPPALNATVEAPPIVPPTAHPQVPHPHVDPWIKPIWPDQARLTFTNEYRHLQERVFTYTKKSRLRWTERAYYDGMRVPHSILSQVYECAGMDMRWTGPGRGLALYPATWERLDHWAKGHKEVLRQRRAEADEVARRIRGEERERELTEWEGLVGISRMKADERELQERKARLSNWRPIGLAPVGDRAIDGAKASGEGHTEGGVREGEESAGRSNVPQAVELQTVSDRLGDWRPLGLAPVRV